MKVSKIWHNAKKERPIESGEYVVMPFRSAFVMTVSYSKKHDAFNVTESCGDIENKMNIAYWTTFKQLGIITRSKV